MYSKFHIILYANIGSVCIYALVNIKLVTNQSKGSDHSLKRCTVAHILWENIKEFN